MELNYCSEASTQSLNSTSSSSVSCSPGKQLHNSSHTQQALLKQAEQQIISCGCELVNQSCKKHLKTRIKDPVAMAARSLFIPRTSSIQAERRASQRHQHDHQARRVRSFRWPVWLRQVYNDQPLGTLLRSHNRRYQFRG